MLALYIALSIGLPNPYWTLITVYIVSQPRAGAVISKSVYRVIGTIVGAGMAVFLVPPLSNAPELLCGVAALWLGLCAFLAATDRTSRSYMFVLAGVSTCVILFPSVENPESVFMTAVTRVEEITLGIACSTIIHAAILPNSSVNLLRTRLDATLDNAAGWIADALSDARPESLDTDRRHLAIAVNEMRDMLVHAGYEGSRIPGQQRLYLALFVQIERILPLSAAVDDRLMDIRRTGAISAGITALLDETREWVTTGSRNGNAAGIEAERLRHLCLALEPAPDAGMSWREALILSLLTRLSDLIDVHRNCLLLRNAIAGEPGDDQDRKDVGSLLREAGSHVIDRDYAGAAMAGGSIAATLFIASLLWIASGWEDGHNAVMMAGIFSTVYSGTADPALFLKNKFIGVILRTLLAVCYVLVILPSIDGFPLLVTVLAPAFILSGLFMTVPKYSALAFNFIVGLSNPTIISAQFQPDFASYLNTSLANLTGIYFAFMMMKLTQSLWLENAAERLLRASWQDIARGRYKSTRQWRGRMGHRIALLATRTLTINANDDTTAKSAADAVQNLRTGIALAELAELGPRLSPQSQTETSGILSDTALYYRGLATGVAEAPPRQLLERIDDAIRGVLDMPLPAVRRGAVVTLTSLRLALYPSAAFDTSTIAGG